jgi:hypothetical protein
VRLGLLSFFQLTPDDREAICGWLADHGVNPSDCDGLRLDGESLPIAECLRVNRPGIDRYEQVIKACNLPPADVMFRWLELERQVAQ